MITSLVDFSGAHHPPAPRGRPAIQVASGYAAVRLPTRARNLPEAPQGLSALFQRCKLFLIFAQDVAHANGTNNVFRQCQRLRLYPGPVFG